MDKILSGLYLGGIRDSRDVQQLTLNNISHIISIHDNPTSTNQNQIPIKYLCIKASDEPDQNLIQYFSLTNEFIHSARLNGGNVLIHCLAGVSRSVTIVIAYIMSITTINWKEGLKCVRAARLLASPNQGFIKQLQEFERTGKLRQERKRLQSKFNQQLTQLTDEEHVTWLIKRYHSLGPIKHLSAEDLLRASQYTSFSEVDKLSSLTRRETIKSNGSSGLFTFG
ncbi:dual specificity protein phosphatase 22-B-like [Panonychus citri]|uniref:dual specificity protein phosphatase 22-B-like n=1 Tax=Panonychus citri TaxID=50023 RepID=UPI0023076E00|nr:dual specificity protein phosphatase 22-B-like [Panonychus citri]